MKKIVIGLMDRLSSYASRDSENNDTVEARKEAEEEATRRLLEQVKISKEREPPEQKQNGNAQPEEGGDKKETKEEPTPEPPAEFPDKITDKEPEPTLPGDTKLYEIFYDQVVNLVKTRALPIHDTIALLVSLANLAL